MENALPRTIGDVFPAHLLSCFKYETLTRVQQHVLPPAFKERFNMMVCAPTGSGKTAVLEAAFLQEYERSRGDPTAKVLYIAPVKALLQERLCDWRDRFGGASIGINFVELSGDTREIDAKELEKAHVLLSTPEKWDAITRSVGPKIRFVSTINTLLVDEIHHIGDKTRGATLEAVLCRMMNISKCEREKLLPVPAAIIRIIGVSATFSNAEDVARWIKCPINGLFQFGGEYRPVPLECVVVECGDASNEFVTERAMDARVPDIIRQYSNGKPSLVFCSSRSSAVRLAAFLSAELRRKGVFDASKRDRKFYLDSLQDNRPKEQVMTALLSGVGYHHAGLSSSERAVVESLFRKNMLPVLCCTSALAVGVNLPSHLVVIKGSRLYGGPEGYTSYPDSRILQMMGRAGRPGYDISGTAVIITDAGEADRIRKIVSDTGSTYIHSQLIDSLPLVVNSEVARNQSNVIRNTTFCNPPDKLPHDTVSNRREASTWIKTTMLWEQLRSKCEEDTGGFLITRAIDSLIKARMITESDDGIVSSTPAGSSMSQGCIQMDSMKRIVGLEGSSKSMSDLLHAVSMCSELRIPLRRHEKALLNRLKDSLKYALAQDADSESAKVSVLIQAALSKATLPDDNLIEEQECVLKEAERLLGVAIDYFRRTKDGDALHAAYRLWRCVSLRCWDDPSGKMSLHQVPGLDLPTAAALEYIGISTVRQLSQATPEKIDSFLRRKSPIGGILVAASQALKTFVLTASWTKQSSISQLRLNVSVSTEHPRLEGAATLLVWTEEKLLDFRPNIVEDYSFEIDLPVDYSKIIHARVFHHAVCGLDSRLRIKPPTSTPISMQSNDRRASASPTTSSKQSNEGGPSAILTSILKLKRLHSAVKQQPISKYMRMVKTEYPDQIKPIPTTLSPNPALKNIAINQSDYERRAPQRRPNQKRRRKKHEPDAQSSPNTRLFEKYCFDPRERHIDGQASEKTHKRARLGDGCADTTQRAERTACALNMDPRFNTNTYGHSTARTHTKGGSHPFLETYLKESALHSEICFRDTQSSIVPNFLNNHVQLKRPEQPTETRSHVIEDEISIVDEDEALNSIFF